MTIWPAFWLLHHNSSKTRGLVQGGRCYLASDPGPWRRIRSWRTEHKHKSHEVLQWHVSIEMSSFKTKFSNYFFLLVSKFFQVLIFCWNINIFFNEINGVHVLLSYNFNIVLTNWLCSLYHSVLCGETPRGSFSPPSLIKQELGHHSMMLNGRKFILINGNPFLRHEDIFCGTYSNVVSLKPRV